MAFLRRTAIGTRAWIAGALAAAAFISVAIVSVVTVEAHNVTASGSYDCYGGWTYTGAYLNGGGGGASDNRLVIVDVRVGAGVINLIREYHYFDTLSSHPPPPAGFILVDHPTTTAFQLFALAGVTSPISVTGSIKVYSAGASRAPSSDAAYPHFLPGDSDDPVPGLAAASQCPSATPTPSATVTATITAAPPTSTLVPPTNTSVPPTLTPVPPRATAASVSVADARTATPLSRVLAATIEPMQLPDTGDGSMRDTPAQPIALMLLASGAAALAFIAVTVEQRRRS